MMFWNPNKNHKGWSSCNIGLGRGDVCGKVMGDQVSVPQAFMADSSTVNKQHNINVVL